MSRTKLALAFVAVMGIAMAARWLFDLAKGVRYEFPDGWFVGLAVFAGVLIGERMRKKAAENG